ncbi:MAG TPA: diguanylate cyclase [bacterium]|jgi:diguanylate cyclase (GGDEF)-like protein|nr:diguanylate cyclase [bacterium]
MASTEIDYTAEGQAVDLELMRGLALGGKSSLELEFLVSSQSAGKADYQALALTVANLSVPDEDAKATFERLIVHQERMQAALGRHVGMKAAAMDLLENVERALKVEADSASPSYWQLEQMAYRDQLTGLRNFRFFSTRIVEEVQRAKRYRHQLSLLMLDIDHFKKFNDTHGHQAGNHALQHLARVVGDTVRDTDSVARYGGEEFAFILPETSKRLAFELAERVRANVESSPVVLQGHHHKITVSLGLATIPRDAFSWQALVEAADQALYQSKQSGRNRVTLFAPGNSVVFRYRPEAGARIGSCSVVGNFNGWDPLADPMNAQEDGAFWLKVGLIPGTYEYKFVVNQEQWIADPLAPERISDGYWGHNSILHLKG